MSVAEMLANGYVQIDEYTFMTPECVADLQRQVREMEVAERLRIPLPVDAAELGKRAVGLSHSVAFGRIPTKKP